MKFNLVLSKEIEEFRDLLNNEKVEILFEQKKNDHVIDLLESKKSLFMFLYNLSQTKLTKLRRYLDDALKKSWIRHLISSIKISILFVSKKNEDLRLCVNYKDLNAIIVENRHLLSLITKILNRLSESKRFTKLDLRNIYHRIRIKRDDEWKTTFRTRYEHFEYQMMSFELANAFAIFQIYINRALRELVDMIFVIYLNDILIYSENSTKY